MSAACSALVVALDELQLRQCTQTFVGQLPLSRPSDSLTLSRQVLVGEERSFETWFMMWTVSSMICLPGCIQASAMYVAAYCSHVHMAQTLSSYMTRDVTFSLVHHIICKLR